MNESQIKEEWSECPTCGGLYKDLTNSDLGQELKKAIEQDDEVDQQDHDCNQNIESNMTSAHCRVCGKSVELKEEWNWREEVKTRLLIV